MIAVVWGLWALYAGWRTARDLQRAEQALDVVRAAVAEGNIDTRDLAADEFAARVSAAADRTDGFTWTGLRWLPVVGDDVMGISALSASLDAFGQGGLGPLLTVIDSLDGLSGDSRIDLEVVDALTEPVGLAYDALERSSNLVEARSSDGFVGVLRERYDDYADFVGELADGLGAAQTAAAVLPEMVGAAGPRDYLMVFQNNAEIRATGGLAGSWARVHAEDGVLSMKEQGAGTDFPTLDTPVLPLTDEEKALYGAELGRFFRNPGFTPDFTRSAELFAGFWNKYASIPIDGVIAVDPVAMSYLLRGTGPVEVDRFTLNSGNAAEALLSQIYEVFPRPADQDDAFQQAARAIFEASTDDLDDPLKFVKGLFAASREGRFLVSSFEPDIQAALVGERVAGELSGDDGETPHVDIGLNDATGAKMSYYLRHEATVSATGCSARVQTIEGTLSLRQTLPASEARDLPDYVTGAGIFGTDPGGQLVVVRLYGPYGGSFVNVTIDGRSVGVDSQRIAGRPVVTLPMLVDSPTPQEIGWSVESAPGQTDDVELNVTPGVVGATRAATADTAC